MILLPVIQQNAAFILMLRGLDLFKASIGSYKILKHEEATFYMMRGHRERTEQDYLFYWSVGPPILSIMKILRPLQLRSMVLVLGIIEVLQ